MAALVASTLGAASLTAAAPALAGPASAAAGGPSLVPGRLLISRSVYATDPATIQPGVTVLPAGCTSGCALATNDAAYPFVWNNEAVDPSFGVTSRIFVDQVTPAGSLVGSILVPNSVDGTAPNGDQLVTSFPSKSELGLNLSLDGRYVTFMGYVAPANALDVSNSNTPGAFDPTNPVPGAYYRAVAEMDRSGNFQFTETNAYSGNNGRAAILNNEPGAAAIYAAGNAGNGGNPQPNGIIIGAGAQIMQPALVPESAQMPGDPTPVGSFNITQLGFPHDKIGKDDNFRGMTVYNHVLYYTKGSGGNGVNTVYFVDTTGHACPGGVGLPDPNAQLPTSPLAYDPAVLQTKGLQPNNMCILRGFPTALKSTTSFPFGVWFANAHTLYVADEGDGTNTYSAATGQYTAAAAQPTAGLQKWVLDAGTWKLAYTLQSGLDLGAPYAVPGYPTGNNPVTGRPWAPATDGLRNVTGRIEPNGTATITAVTSTVSGNTDQGADPNKVVSITDDPSAAAPTAGETFATIRAAGNREVLRGVSYTPGTTPNGTGVSCSPGGVRATTATTCTVTVTGAVHPGGTVTFTSDGSGGFSAATCGLTAIGGNQSRCSVTYTPAAVGSGTHTITANYTGDANDAASSASVAVVVQAASSATSLACAPSAVGVGEATTCTATVTGAAGPTGTVAFASNASGGFGAPSCVLSPIGAGQASCSVTYVPAGAPAPPTSHAIYANYAGDGNNRPSHTSTRVTVHN